MELELQRDSLKVKCELEGNVLKLALYRGSRVGLRIHEKLKNVLEEIRELRSRPRWLGEDSDSLIRECLLKLEGMIGDEKG